MNYEWLGDGSPEADVEVIDLPLRLREEGIRVGVLTASPRLYAEALLEHFGIIYDGLVTGSDGYAAKPDPAGLRALAEELGVEIGSCAHVGDLDTDVAAAAMELTQANTQLQAALQMRSMIRHNSLFDYLG